LPSLTSPNFSTYHPTIMDPSVFVFGAPASGYPERFRQLFLRNFMLHPKAPNVV
jgi:hypothetical protein